MERSRKTKLEKELKIIAKKMYELSKEYRVYMSFGMFSNGDHASCTYQEEDGKHDNKYINVVYYGKKS